MFSAILLVRTLVVFFTFAPYAYVHAHSSTPRPLAKVEHPTTHALEILPRTPNLLHARAVPDSAPVLRHTDAFRLTLEAFGETFYLHLRPNEHLIHPDARINFYRPGPDGSAVQYDSRPILAQDVHAYEGEVVLASHTDFRMREDTAGIVRYGPGPGEIGWARIMVHEQGDTSAGSPPVFEGAFTSAGIVHHVSTRVNYLRNRRDMDPRLSDDNSTDGGLVIWRESDLMSPEQELSAALTGPPLTPAPQARTCASDKLSFNSDANLNPALRPRRRADVPSVSAWYDPFGLGTPSSLGNATVKRDDISAGGASMTSNFVNQIGNTAGCPKEQRIVFTGVAADCEYVQRYGNVQNATNQILAAWNTASNLFKQTFNVSLGIIQLEMHDPICPQTADPQIPWNVNCNAMNLDNRLSAFSDWRGKRSNDGAGLWHLLSGCPTGDEVGIAWLATLCQTTMSSSGNASVSGTAVSTAGRTEWQVIAHETGHNFGAIHDCAGGCKDGDMCCPLTTSTCDANSSFLMSPTANTNEKLFSPCSIGNICSLMEGPEEGGGGFTNKSCLISPRALNTPKLISLKQCGNGIVEPDSGEECDPGPSGNSQCCTSECKFKTGAVCDPTNSPCCTDTCGFASSSLVCRAAKDGVCDTAETCTGNSSACPADIFKPNGMSCGSNLACASGTCTSNSKQCQQMGSSLGLQTECPQMEKSCSITCQDPKNSRQCISLQSILIDGSPCGYAGTCDKGNCKPGPLFDMAKTWFVKNLTVSIPLAIGVGIFLLLLSYAVISAIRSCFRSKPKPKYPEAPPIFVGPPPAGRNASQRRAQPPLTQPGPHPSNGGSIDATSIRSNGGRTLPFPSGPGQDPYQRQMRSDGDWVSFDATGGRGKGQGQGQSRGNTYSGWSAPR